MKKQKIRVLFNSPDPRLHGGPPTHLPLLEEQLRQHLTMEPFQYGRRTDHEMILDKLFGRSADLFKLRSKISLFQPNIIHHNTAFDPIAIYRDAPLVWLAKRYNIPVLLKMHGSRHELLDRIMPPLKQLRNFIFRYASCIGVLSEVEKEEYVKAWPLLNGRVKVVKNIIKPAFHKVKRHESESPTILFISRFIREKGVFDLLSAIPGVLKKYPAAQFIFIGSGNDAPKFDERVREKKLNRSVERIDHLDNYLTVDYYGSAWAFVFPTQLREGMPMVVAEAMAVGVPIITTRTKFSESYMLDGKHCLFINVKSPSSIEHKITYLLDQTRLRQEMSKNNRELAKSFQAKVVTEEFINIYHEFSKRMKILEL